MYIEDMDYSSNTYDSSDKVMREHYLSQIERMRKDAVAMNTKDTNNMMVTKGVTSGGSSDEIAGAFSPNFDATLLSETIVVIEKIKYSGIMWNIYNPLSSIGEIVKSEDSNLSTTIDNLVKTLIAIKSKLDTILTDLSDQIKAYALSTIENESGTTQSLDEINTELDSINSMLDAL